MATANILNEIETALAGITQGDFVEAGCRLLETLGYRSDRTLDLSGDVQEFIDIFPASNPGTLSETRFQESVTSVRIMFQFTDSEIAASQPSLLGSGSFDIGIIRSFMFIAVELCDESYPRGAYVELTREINKRLVVPVVVLFRTDDDRLSLAFVHRRQHKRDPNREVLGNVSLIREISPAKPHRAHLDILRKLALPERLDWMDIRRKQRTFDGLLVAWLDALDTEELNRNFYEQLFEWFECAVKDAKFPAKQPKTLPPAEHVIRLITRLLFVWFIKEKGLIAPELFIEEEIKTILRDYDRDTGDSYYRAVLQNLFFATLNTDIGHRSFSEESGNTYRVFTRYRYKVEIADPARLRMLFSKTPFINGGLFDCLDTEEGARKGGSRIDCFTDSVNDPNRNDYKILSIPNRLFFGENGLISLFDRFQFTVEENTPAEKEVALDPELLGKVFENLLAANVEETRESARKQTGSYYTPREVVDYMVDEALVTTLVQECAPSDGNTDNWRDRLLDLLDYEVGGDDIKDRFSDTEKKRLVRAIAGIKLIDPAVGSGAFPMGALHKLTLALRRLDPQNTLWESLQKELAGQLAAEVFDTHDLQTERDLKLEEISDTFEKYRNSDFGRKLYLIQNSIYGVDIQPIACQIARLRFFISLAIEQSASEEAVDNYGIKPLPNLETRFVAANTLVGLDSQSQMLLGQNNPLVDDLQRELNANRENHFHATTRRKKLECRETDERLREELADALEQNGLPTDDAEKISQWNPYDQNASADWFDPKYMFNITDGFDVVLGNPPYVQLQKNSGKLGKLYKDAGYATFASTGDIYQLFYERGMHLLKQTTGHLCYISSNQWMRVDSGRPLRGFIEDQNPVRLVNLGANVFENVTVNTCVLLANRSGNLNVLQAADLRQGKQQFPPAEWSHMRPENGETWIVLSEDGKRIRDKIEVLGTPLKEWDVFINYGIKTGYNKAFIVDADTKESLVAQDPNSAEILKPVLRGSDIKRFRAQWEKKWLIATFPSLHLDIDDYPAVKGHLLTFGRDRLAQCGKSLPGGGKSRKKTKHSWFETQDSIAYYREFSKDKISWGNLCNEAKYSYTPAGMYVNAPSPILTPYSHYLLAILNSKLLDWYFKLIGVERDGGYFEYKPMFIERLPVPQLPVAEQLPFDRLVERILSEKESDPLRDTSELEREIDRLVYNLFELTEEEIAIVEDTLIAD